MRSSDIKKYVSLRDALVTEKADLEARLVEINAALGGGETVAPKRRGQKPGRPAVAGKKIRRGKRAKNTIGLRDAVLTVTAKKPLGRKEILDAVVKLGYTFTAKNPLNSLNTLLYTAKGVKNFGGKFGPAK